MIKKRRRRRRSLLCSNVYVIFAKGSLSCACAKAFLMSHSSRKIQWSGNCLDKHLKNMHTGGNCFSTGRHSMTHCGLFRLEAHCLSTSTLISSLADQELCYAVSAQCMLGEESVCSAVLKFYLLKIPNWLWRNLNLSRIPCKYHPQCSLW